MAIYFGTTEITKLRDLAPQTGLDIADLWFGSTNVYTVWQVYEGTLPATIISTGDDMRQYQVWGNTGGVGDDSGTAYGYKVDIGVKSSNVMPSAPAETKTLNGVTITCDGEGRYSISGKTDQNTDIIFDIPSFTVPVSIYNGGNGFMMLHNTASSNVNLDFLYNGTNKDAWSLAKANRTSTTFSRLSGNSINAIRFHVTPGTVNGIVCPMFTNNGESTLVKYQPYSNTATPIYIGDEPLEKDEYVDFGEQKIYRMVDSTLTPTNPPVPLPALPTCEGETIIEYAGQSVAPEKVLLKYRKEGF